MRGLVRPAQYAALALYILFLGFPLLWLMSASVKSSGELNSLTVSLLPSEWHWENYTEALDKQGLIRSAGNSLFVALASTALAVLIAVPAAYVLARLRGKLRVAACRLDPGQPGVPGRADHPAAVPDPADARAGRQPQPA